MRKYILLILMSLTFSALADNFEKIIENQTGKMLFAFMSEDLDTYSKYIYPKIVEFSGGKKVLISKVKNELFQQKNEGMRFLSYDVISVSEPIYAGLELHSVVKYSITMSTKNGDTTVQTYFVAVSDHSGKNWTFVDGSLLSSLKADRIFPHYNPSLQLPTEVETTKALSNNTQYIDIDAYLELPEELRGVYAAGMTDAFIYLSKKTGYMSGLEDCLIENGTSARVISKLIEKIIDNWKKTQPGKDVEISMLYDVANKKACADFIKQ